MKQPTSPTGNPLDYRCPSCGLFPGQPCRTHRGTQHKRRIEVANGTRDMVPDDAPDTNKWFKDFIEGAISEGLQAEATQKTSKMRKARFLNSIH